MITDKTIWIIRIIFIQNDNTLIIRSIKKLSAADPIELKLKLSIHFSHTKFDRGEKKIKKNRTDLTDVTVLALLLGVFERRQPSSVHRRHFWLSDQNSARIWRARVSRSEGLSPNRGFRSNYIQNDRNLKREKAEVESASVNSREGWICRTRNASGEGVIRRGTLYFTRMLVISPSWRRGYDWWRGGIERCSSCQSAAEFLRDRCMLIFFRHVIIDFAECFWEGGIQRGVVYYFSGGARQ